MGIFRLEMFVSLIQGWDLEWGFLYGKYSFEYRDG